MKIFEAEWNGLPTYLITNENQTSAIKFIDPVSNEIFWTDRLNMAWHNPNKHYVESVLTELNELKNKTAR